MLEDLRWGVEIDERVESVAHRVLDGVAALDVAAEVVFTQLVAETFEHFDELGLHGTQFVVGGEGARVDGGAAGQCHDDRFDRLIGVLHGAAGHARGVVGDHAADGAGDLGRRIRAELAPVAGQGRVHLADGEAWLHSNALAAVEDLQTTEMAPHVDGETGIHRLSGEARGSPAQGQRPAHLGSHCHGGSDVLRRLGAHHGVRGAHVVGGVDCQRHAIQFACAHRLSTECGAQCFHRCRVAVGKK